MEVIAGWLLFEVFYYVSFSVVCSVMPARFSLRMETEQERDLCS